MARAGAQAFERSIERAPNYLMTRVLYAQYFATNQQKRELFEQQLGLTATIPADVLPGAGPENIVAKRIARALMARRGDLVYVP